MGNEHVKRIVANIKLVDKDIQEFQEMQNEAAQED
jgi:hypothetical protein